MYQNPSSCAKFVADTKFQYKIHSADRFNTEDTAAFICPIVQAFTDSRLNQILTKSEQFGLGYCLHRQDVLPLEASKLLHQLLCFYAEAAWPAHECFC